jgi:hypothetical protein
MNREQKVGCVFVILTCCVAALPASTEPKRSERPSADAKQQVLDLENEWVAAEIKHDPATLRRILDDKFVATFGAGKRYDKEGFVKGIVGGDVDPTESQTLTDGWTGLARQKSSPPLGTLGSFGVGFDRIDKPWVVLLYRGRAI